VRYVTSRYVAPRRFARSALTKAEHELTCCESQKATMTVTTSPSQSSFMPPAEPYGSGTLLAFDTSAWNLDSLCRSLGIDSVWIAKPGSID